MKNAFLHGTPTKTVYCTQSIGFVDPTHPDMVCKLNKSLYGLKQAPGLGIVVSLPSCVRRASSRPSQTRPCSSFTAYFLLYIDDIVITASSSGLLYHIISCLQQEFAMKDLGVLHHFLGGVTVERRPQGMFLHQRRYTVDLLERAGMAKYKLCATQVDTQGRSPPLAPRLPIRPATGALSGHCSTSPSPGPTLPMSSSRCASTCTTLGSRTTLR
jgi:hypothetical protein